MSCENVCEFITLVNSNLNSPYAIDSASINHLQEVKQSPAKHWKHLQIHPRSIIQYCGQHPFCFGFALVKLFQNLSEGRACCHSPSTSQSERLSQYFFQSHPLVLITHSLSKTNQVDKFSSHKNEASMRLMRTSLPTNEEKVPSFGLRSSYAIIADQSSALFINADYSFKFVKIINKTINYSMKGNPQIFGLPKQLYQTSYTTLDSSRSSSLNNSNFTHSVHHHNAHSRPQKPSQVLLIREIPRNNLSVSQANPQEFRPISPPRDYYGENSKGEDMFKQIQQRLEDMSRKITKNTQEINLLKNKEKITQPAAEGKFIQELQKIQEKQEEISKECLLRITTLREEVSEMCGKSTKLQQEILQRIGIRFDEKQLIKVRSIIEERVKQQTSKIRLIIENETNKMAHDLKWELKRDQPATSPIKSKLKYPFKSLKLTYKEYLDVGKRDKGRLSTRESSESPRSGTVRIGNELTYYVDKQGYLLDQDNCYLLDDNQNLIRLNGDMLEQLRREGLLKQ